MKATRKHLPLALSAILFAPLLAQAASTDGATQEAVDPERSGEVLAHASYRSGEGLIKIQRIVEDGVDGILVTREARIGDDYRMPEEWARLPLTERASLVYEDLSGQALPEKAVAAFRELEALRALRDESFDLSFPVAPSKNGQATCTDTASGEFFDYDCYVYGPIYKAESNVDDVCLLTAAITGNHTQEIAYRAANGTYYLNFSADVMQGHFRATEVLTGVRRTRRGQIYNASASDYTRFNYIGDSKLELFYDPKGNSECYGLADN